MKFEVNYSIQQSVNRKLSFSLRETYPLRGKRLGIFGQSGTGKSTLLKAIAGLIGEAHYSLHYNEQDYNDVDATNNPCVYVGSDSILFDHLSVKGNLELVRKHSASAIHCELSSAEVISLCGIEHLLEQGVSGLSSGEKQRVAFARALLSGKRLLLLDEAFSALDWSARASFLARLGRLQKNYRLDFIIVSHSLKELALGCDDIWVLQQGKFVLQCDLDTALDGAIKTNKEHLATVPNLTQGSQGVFSVIKLEYIKKDKIDDGLEVWQLPAYDNIAAQTIFKRARKSDHAPIAQSKDDSDCSDEREKRFLIEADTISLSAQQSNYSSMLNCVAAVVVDIQRRDRQKGDDASGMMIKLQVNGQTLRSFISKRSFVHMGLNKGDKVFAVFKAL